MEPLLLVIIGLAPPIGFLAYILYLDRIEPEPMGFIVKVLLLGGLTVIPVGLAELALMNLAFFSGSGLTGAARKSFLLIAPLEEAAKLALVMLVVWRNRNFNEENDGIVYTGTAAIGFAMVENLLYVAQFGIATGIMRAVTAIPLHTFTGVLMGYFIGIARFAPTPRRTKKNIAAGFLIALVFHAVYDTFVLSETPAALLMIPIVIALFIMGIVFLRKGRASSALRWKGTQSEPAPMPEAPAAPLHTPDVEAVAAAVPAPSRGGYRGVIARIILSLCAVFWALVIVGIMSDNGSGTIDAMDAVAGGIIITAIPLAIGIVLEVSHRRRRRESAA
ncbi:MAG: PrsW family intramembrane metalloprotease [Spirochaetes bacterium]|nr:PrsW family intramembrane metalloprotease [Spirochaetota bacterium]